MKIYHYDSETLELIGESEADESPLEPGIFLIPANSTADQPLPQVAGKTRHYEGGLWVYRDIPEPPAPHVKTAEEIKAEKNAKVQADIYAIEAGQNSAVREALLNMPGAVGKLAAIDAQIAALRAQLV